VAHDELDRVQIADRLVLLGPREIALVSGAVALFLARDNRVQHAHGKRDILGLTVRDEDFGVLGAFSGLLAARAGDEGLVLKIASSSESVGDGWLGQVAERVK